MGRTCYGLHWPRPGLHIGPEPRALYGGQGRPVTLSAPKLPFTTLSCAFRLMPGLLRHAQERGWALPRWPGQKGPGAEDTAHSPSMPLSQAGNGAAAAVELAPRQTSLETGYRQAS